jgi:hypothetical protein
MQSFFNELRYPLSALFLLLLASVYTAIQQHRMEQALFLLEEAKLTFILAKLKPTELTFIKSRGTFVKPDATDTEYEREQDAIRGEFNTIQEKFAPFGTIEIIGQFKNRCQSGCEYNFFSDEGNFWLVAAPLVEEPFKSELEIRQAERASYDAEAAKPGSLLPKTQPDRQLFYVGVQIGGQDELFSGHRLIFDNIERFDNIQQGSITDDGPFSFPADVATMNRTRDGYFSNTLRQTRQQLGVTATSVIAAYRELRAKYEQRELTLPVISLTIGPSFFITAALFISIGLGAWASFLLRSAKSNLGSDKGAPWILVEPFRQVTVVSKFEMPIAILELGLFMAFHLVSFFAPVLIWVAMAWSGSANLWVTLIAAVPATLFSASLVANYAVIARRAVGMQKPTTV